MAVEALTLEGHEQRARPDLPGVGRHAAVADTRLTGAKAEGDPNRFIGPSHHEPLSASATMVRSSNGTDLVPIIW